jgi:hypothetical protein
VDLVGTSICARPDTNLYRLDLSPFNFQLRNDQFHPGADLVRIRDFVLVGLYDLHVLIETGAGIRSTAPGRTLRVSASKIQPS